MNRFDFSGERAMSPAQSEDSGLAADRGTTYATISLPRENAPAMGIIFLGKPFNQQSISLPTYKIIPNKPIEKDGFWSYFSDVFLDEKHITSYFSLIDVGYAHLNCTSYMMIRHSKLG